MFRSKPACERNIIFPAQASACERNIIIPKQAPACGRMIVLIRRAPASKNQQKGSEQMPNYLNIVNVSGEDKRLVKQDLKFRTGKFIWRIVFNIPLNPATVNNDNLMVYTSQGTLVDTKISYNPDLHAIEIEPTYASGENYTLHVTKKVESKGGQNLKNEIDLEFVV